MTKAGMPSRSLGSVGYFLCSVESVGLSVLGSFLLLDLKIVFG